MMSKVSKTFLLVLLFLTMLSQIPQLFGFTATCAVSGSMEPTLSVGSLAFVKASEYAIDDVVQFAMGEDIVLHRIVADNSTTFGTKGDANPTPDPWQIDKNDVQGKLYFSIPYLGYYASLLATVHGKLIVIMCAILLFVASRLDTGVEKSKKEVGG